MTSNCTSNSNEDAVRTDAPLRPVPRLLMNSPYVEDHERFLVFFVATYDPASPDVNVTDEITAAAATLDLINSNDGKLVWIVLDRRTNVVHWLEQRQFEQVDISPVDHVDGQLR